MGNFLPIALFYFLWATIENLSPFSRRFTPMPRSLFRVGTLSFILLLLTSPHAFSGQIVNMTVDVTSINSVYGNSTNTSPGVDGNTLDSLPTGNTVNNNGYGSHFIIGAQTLSGDSTLVTGNTVNITGNAAINTLRGGTANASDVTFNTVNVSNGAFIEITGGQSASGNADNNTVIIDNGTVGNYFMAPSATGGYSNAGNANDNTLIINGGTFKGIVSGGRAAGSGNANNNTLIINGGRFYDYVWGGSTGASGGEASGNTVTISGTPDLTGVYLGGGLPGDSISSRNNTLNLHSAGLTVSFVNCFQNFNFYVPASLSNGGTMLTVSNGADITDATVNVGIEGGASPLKAGDTVVLIDASSSPNGLTGTPANTTANGQGMQGVTLQYTFDILTDNNKLLATLPGGTSPTVNEQTKALSEGFVSGLGLVTQGADVAAGQGMTSAVSAAKNGAASGYGLAGFGALSGGSVRYNSGSHVDMHSLTLLAGLALGTDIAPGRLTLGAFFEYGNGSYNTYNSFSTAASVDGNGNTHYLGGGILGRMDFINTGPGHFYAEASGRAGNVYNKYESSDLRDAKGREASYDSTSAYYGLHLGTGYIWNITDAASLDLYGKYFWTRQTGDSITLSTGDPIDFEDVYSSRLRFGSRFAYAVNEYVSPYVGAAWEHEFDGKARASTYGYDIKAPSLRGDTGIGELGLTFKPSQTVPLSFDLGVQGYVGKREGVTGSLQAKYEF